MAFLKALTERSVFVFLLRSPEEVDDQLLSWIDWAYGFVQKKRRGGNVHRMKKGICDEGYCPD